MSGSPPPLRRKPYRVPPSAQAVWICACGLSKNKPFCDGSHVRLDEELMTSARQSARTAVASSEAVSQRKLGTMLRSGVRMVLLHNVDIVFTKSGRALINGILERAVDAEMECARVLSEADVTKEHVLDWLRHTDPDAVIDRWPLHHPVRISAFDATTEAVLFDNVFICPCNNLVSILLLDSWDRALDEQALPLFAALFDSQTLEALLPSVLPGLRRQGMTVLHSHLHELCHRLGPVVVTPCADPALRLSDFWFDFAGEASTEAHCALFAARISPAFGRYVSAKRLPGHWILRCKPTDGDIVRIHDNDALVGALNWAVGRSMHIIEPSGDGKWCVDWVRVHQIHEHVLQLLASVVVCDDQDKGTIRSVGQYLPFQDGGFVLPPELAAVCMQPVRRQGEEVH